MKSNHTVLLALALSAGLSTAACNRDRTSNDVQPPAADTTTAPAPAEPAPAPAPAPMPTPAPVDSGMTFAAMDKNSDGSITPDELAPTEMLSQHFSEADTDGDGKLSSAEVDAHRAQMAAAPGG